MLKFPRSFLIFSILSCYASYADAVIEAVITSAARTEQSGVSSAANISTITRVDIESSGVSHIVDVLRGHAGMLVTDSFGDGSRAVISMRGFSSSTANSNTLILIDGRRLNNIDISNPDLNSISLKDVERIEVTQGGAGVLYGDQAVGGVVNIITKKIKGKLATLEGSVGSYNRVGLRGAYSDNLTQDIHYDVSAEIRQSDNYRRQNNEIDYASIFAKSDYIYPDGRMFVELQKVSEDLRTPGALLASDLLVDRRQTLVDFLGDFTESETEVFRFGVKHKMNSQWFLEGEMTRRDVEREIQQSFRGFAILSSKSLKRSQKEFTPRLVGVIPEEHGDAHITAGIDIISTDFDSRITSATDIQKLWAEYVLVVFPVQQRLKISAGLRHAKVWDEITSDFTNGKQKNAVNVAEIGLTYEVSDTINVFGKFDQSFRFAKVDELTYVSPGVQLKPQTGDSIELGMRYKQGANSYKVALYHMTIKDEIAFDSSATKPIGGFFAGANVNYDPTTHQGLTFDLDYAVSPELTVSSSYSYTNASFDSGLFATKTISGVPENNGRLTINYLATSSINVFLGAVYTGSQYVDGDNLNVMDKLPGYTVVNANLIFKQKNWKLNFKVNNITGRQYVENANSFGSLFPSPERNFLLSALWQFR